jgi:hypothetical protein
MLTTSRVVLGEWSSAIELNIYNFILYYAYERGWIYFYKKNY